MATLADSMETPASGGLTWSHLWLALPIVTVALILLFFDTARELYDIWMTSDTYAHGLLIAPISLWLVWEKRQGLRGARPVPTLLPVVLTIPVGLLWLTATIIDVLLVQEYAFVGMLILAIWAMIGTPVARYLAFPLAFLLLAVPAGDGLLYPMMNFTADFTVGALRLTGIPVYRDGTFFSIPSGDWSVVEACSGLRYLLASVTLGVLYAYLTYRKQWKRLIFICFSVAVPVIANGLRAYMIVMIAHLSEMRYAVGVDHLLYGWVFFGIIVMLMFAIGAIWRDPPGGTESVVMGTKTGRLGSLLLVGACVLVVAASFSAAAWVTRPPSSVEPVHLSLPNTMGDWQAKRARLWRWRPRFVGTDGQLLRFYGSAQGEAASIFIGAYRYQRSGAEATSVVNQMLPEQDPDRPEWSDKEITRRSVQLPEGRLDVVQHRLTSVRGDKLLLWSWYRIGDVDTSDRLLAKLVELGNRLTGGPSQAAVIAVAAPYRARPEEAEPVLRSFLAASLPDVRAEIRAIGAASK